ncbi:MAG: type II toxin-antitoxin system RelE/ParE family toxin [Actinobacteria bacterium]|nr:type II toxin-antitoxin system RelE/ParE family toxin [Actinomycetota bacterium]
MKVTWSPLADEQVDDAVAYISDDNPAAALQWLERLLDRTKSLGTFPDSGRLGSVKQQLSGRWDGSRSSIRGGTHPG